MESSLISTTILTNFCLLVIKVALLCYNSPYIWQSATGINTIGTNLLLCFRDDFVD